MSQSPITLHSIVCYCTKGLTLGTSVAWFELEYRDAFSVDVVIEAITKLELNSQTRHRIGFGFFTPTNSHDFKL